MSTEKTGKPPAHPRDAVDAMKTRARAAGAALEESLTEQDESLPRAEACGRAAVRDAERANASTASEHGEPTKDKYFEIDKRVGGAEIALAEELAEAGQARPRHHRGSGSTR